MANYGKWKSTGKTIGEGGQGQINLVTDRTKSLEGLFALKKLVNNGRLDRFKEEIKAAVELDHPSIIEIIDFNWENKSPYMVMNYYKNGNLTNLDLDNYSIDDKLRIFRTICNAIAYAHNNNVIHRDLKPENILLSDNNEPLIADFGLCYFTDSSERITLTNEAVGPRYYMAPELEEGKVYEIFYSSDVYSLGKILYWLITGNIFSREKHNEEEYDITKINKKSIYYLINEFLDKLITTHPSDRLENGQAVLDELDVLIKRINAGANRIGPGIPQTCIYCGLGNYVKLPQTDRIGVSYAVTYFNFPNNKSLKVFVCDYCSNVQIFHTKLLKGSDKWKKD